MVLGNIYYCHTLRFVDWSTLDPSFPIYCSVELEIGWEFYYCVTKLKDFFRFLNILQHKRGPFLPFNFKIMITCIAFLHKFLPYFYLTFYTGNYGAQEGTYRTVFLAFF